MRKKLKTNKLLLRRVKITATGKILHGSSFKRHLRRNKSARQKRRFRQIKEFPLPIKRKIKKALGVT